MLPPAGSGRRFSAAALSLLHSVTASSTWYARHVLPQAASSTAVTCVCRMLPHLLAVMVSCSMLPDRTHRQRRHRQHFRIIDRADRALRMLSLSLAGVQESPIPE